MASYGKEHEKKMPMREGKHKGRSKWVSLLPGNHETMTTLRVYVLYGLLYRPAVRPIATFVDTYGSKLYPLQYINILVQGSCACPMYLVTRGGNVVLSLHNAFLRCPN